MKIELEKLSCKYGSPMGRCNNPINGKCHLQLVPLYDGAYDKGGAYWGIGESLYVCQNKDGNQFFTRGTTRDAAKKVIIEYNKGVTFFK